VREPPEMGAPAALAERDLGHCRARRPPDEWTGLRDRRFNAAPLGHEHFELTGIQSVSSTSGVAMILPSPMMSASM
jgi:hypothetical protein